MCHTHAPPLCTLLSAYWPDLGGPHQQCLWFLLGLSNRAPAGVWKEEGEWLRLFSFLLPFEFTVARLCPSPTALLLSQQLSPEFWKLVLLLPLQVWGSNSSVATLSFVVPLQPCSLFWDKSSSKLLMWVYHMFLIEILTDIPIATYTLLFLYYIYSLKYYCLLSNCEHFPMSLNVWIAI